MFIVQSTSTETPEAARAMRVLARTRAAKVIAYASCFNCRVIAGSRTYSQHAWGNADDMFPKLPSGDDAGQRKLIADTLIWQATHHTVANRFKKLRIAHLINHDARRMWTPTSGWVPYGGTTGDHIHADYIENRTGTPPCAQ